MTESRTETVELRKRDRFWAKLKGWLCQRKTKKAFRAAIVLMFSMIIFFVNPPRLQLAGFLIPVGVAFLQPWSSMGVVFANCVLGIIGPQLGMLLAIPVAATDARTNPAVAIPWFFVGNITFAYMTAVLERARLFFMICAIIFSVNLYIGATDTDHTYEIFDYQVPAINLQINAGLTFVVNSLIFPEPDSVEFYLLASKICSNCAKALQAAAERFARMGVSQKASVEETKQYRAAQHARLSRVHDSLAASSISGGVLDRDSGSSRRDSNGHQDLAAAPPQPSPRRRLLASKRRSSTSTATSPDSQGNGTDQDERNYRMAMEHECHDEVNSEGTYDDDAGFHDHLHALIAEINSDTEKLKVRCQGALLELNLSGIFLRTDEVLKWVQAVSYHVSSIARHTVTEALVHREYNQQAIRPFALQLAEICERLASVLSAIAHMRPYWSRVMGLDREHIDEHLSDAVREAEVRTASIRGEAARRAMTPHLHDSSHGHEPSHPLYHYSRKKTSHSGMLSSNPFVRSHSQPLASAETAPPATGTVVGDAVVIDMDPASLRPDDLNHNTEMGPTRRSAPLLTVSMYKTGKEDKEGRDDNDMSRKDSNESSSGSPSVTKTHGLPAKKVVIPQQEAFHHLLHDRVLDPRITRASFDAKANDFLLFSLDQLGGTVGLDFQREQGSGELRYTHWRPFSLAHSHMVVFRLRELAEDLSRLREQVLSKGIMEHEERTQQWAFIRRDRWRLIFTPTRPYLDLQDLRRQWIEKPDFVKKKGNWRASMSAFYQFCTSMYALFALKTATAITLFYFPVFVAHFTFPWQWSFITVLVVNKLVIGATSMAAVLRIIGTIAGGVAAIAVYYIAHATEWIIVMLITIYGFTVVYGLLTFTKYPYAFTVMLVTMPVVLLSWYRDFDNGDDSIEPHDIALQRVAATLFGVVASLILNRSLWPVRAYDQIAFRASEAFFRLTELEYLLRKGLNEPVDYDEAKANIRRMRKERKARRKRTQQEELQEGLASPQPSPNDKNMTVGSSARETGHDIDDTNASAVSKSTCSEADNGEQVQSYSPRTTVETDISVYTAVTIDESSVAANPETAVVENAADDEDNDVDGEQRAPRRSDPLPKDGGDDGDGAGGENSDEDSDCDPRDIAGDDDVDDCPLHGPDGIFTYHGLANPIYKDMDFSATLREKERAVSRELDVMTTLLPSAMAEPNITSYFPAHEYKVVISTLRRYLMCFAICRRAAIHGFDPFVQAHFVEPLRKERRLALDTHTLHLHIFALSFAMRWPLPGTMPDLGESMQRLMNTVKESPIVRGRAKRHMHPTEAYYWTFSGATHAEQDCLWVIRKHIPGIVGIAINEPVAGDQICLECHHEGPLGHWFPEMPKQTPATMASVAEDANTKTAAAQEPLWNSRNVSQDTTEDNGGRGSSQHRWDRAYAA
eukprot:Clim_evm18s29 gene=Clim_evmTU18s29